MSVDVVFRADASLMIGAGHVMRCLTLADALAERGYKCHFICRDLPGNLLEQIRRRGHGFAALPRGTWPESENTTVHGHWLQADWREDADQTRVELQRLAPQWLIVDHYALDAEWETSVRQRGLRIGVIDDLADRQHVGDWLLDQNLGRLAKDYVGKVPVSCQCLIGPEYALLRPDFAQWRPYSLRRRAQTPVRERILVSLGGVDQNNVTGKILAALAKTKGLEDTAVTVVLGEQSPWASGVKKQVEDLSLSIELKVGVDNMAELLAKSDLCIGASGSSAWERCCLGVPSWLVVLAENQWGAAKALEASGAAIILRPTEEGKFSSAISEQPFAKGSRKEAFRVMTEASQAVTDGKGVDRVMAVMEGAV